MNMQAERKSPQRMRWVLGSLVGLGLLLGASIGCHSSQPNNAPESTDAKNSTNSSPPAFDFRAIDGQSEENRGEGRPAIKLVEKQEELGLHFTYENGARGRSLFVETIGGGGGWLDYDLDGWPDVFLAQGGDATAVDTQGQPSDQLFRNLLGQRFEALDTGRTYLEETHYSQGVGIADFNEDGFPDIYVTNVGKNTFWINCGDGTFVEAGEQARVAYALWSVSVAWADLDQDGDLDLYVTNYCDYDPLRPPPCLDRQGRDTLCNPGELPPLPDHYYRNEGDGTFTEQSQQLGLAGVDGRGLGVVVADFTGDRLPDIYVANDTTDNFLFVQDEGGHFTEQATLRGCAVDRSGAPQGSMGLAVADYDHNGWLDIYTTHFFEESNTLYANQGDRGFQDLTARAGLHRPTLPYLGFGTAFCDFNMDGLLELVVANGHVDTSARVSNPKMKSQIFTCNLTNTWSAVTNAGPYFEKPRLGRGLAKADYDRDGDIDLLVCNENDPAVILANESNVEDSLTLQLRFRGIESNRNGIGCHARVTYGGQTRYQQLVGGSSYAASHQPVLRFGFTKQQEAGPARVEVIWPSGRTQVFEAEWNEELVVVEPRPEES